MADNGESGGLLRRALNKLSSSTVALEADELRHHAAEAGCAPIAEQTDREMATLHGTLRAVTLQPRGGVCALEAELYDGTGSVTLVWLGRRRIPGIDPGRELTVRGRLGRRDGERVMYNPHYKLTP